MTGQWIESFDRHGHVTTKTKCAQGPYGLLEELSFETKHASYISMFMCNNGILQ